MTASPTPAVSVVLATCDRAERLSRALAAISAQDFDDSFEVIVVDDASHDGTPRLLADAETGSGIEHLRVIRREVRGGPGAARNTGWRSAIAPLVAFTDDDCEPTPGWLRAIVGAATVGPSAMVQGLTLPNTAERHRLGPFARTLDVRALGPWYPAANMAYGRDLLQRLDGFDEKLSRGEDTDLAWRAQELGADPILAPGAIVEHAVFELGVAGQLRLTAAWMPAFRNFKRHPALRRALHRGLFWKPTHPALLAALCGVALSRRFPPAILLTVPYLRLLAARATADGAPLGGVAFYPIVDATEIATALVGSTRAGTLVL